MFNIESYMDKLILLLRDYFKHRLLYVGLQGSYLRSEADENSDIDVMVVLSDLAIQDLDSYKNILLACGNYHRSCGFICGKAELCCWNPLEICHLLHTTKDHFGKLKGLVPAYTMEDEKNYIRLSLDNLFHELCHGYIHCGREENIARLPVVYKSVFFILQNICYYNTGTFASTKQDLLARINDDHREVLATAMRIKSDAVEDFDYLFKVLFEWCQKMITRI